MKSSGKSGRRKYRFGFNGKENDREWGGQLIQDYGFRLYNPAIGKFLSVDPLMPDYPAWTPYAFAMNRVIDGIDLDGLEWESANPGGNTWDNASGGSGAPDPEPRNEAISNTLRFLETTKWAIRNSDVDGRPSSVYENGFMRGKVSNVSAAAHALNLYGEASNSPWISASRRLPFGSKFHQGHSFWINIGQAKRTGTKYVGEIQLRVAVSLYSKTLNISEIGRVNKWRSQQGFFGGEREVLFNESIDPSAIDSKTTVGLKMFGKGLMAYGLANTGIALHQAHGQGEQAFKDEGIRQASAWGTSFATAWGFAKLGVTYGAGYGLATGPGMFFTGLAGGIGGGMFGYWLGGKYVESTQKKE